MKNTIIVLVLLLLVACGPPDAKYKEQIPLFPGATYKNFTNENPGGDKKATSWFYTTSEASKKVVEFYQKEWETAHKSQEDEETVFEYQPAGASKIKDDLYETVKVRIYKDGDGTTIRVTETVKG